MFSIGGARATCHSNVFTLAQCGRWGAGGGGMEAITGRSHLAPGGKESKPAVLLNMIKLAGIPKVVWVEGCVGWGGPRLHPLGLQRSELLASHLHLV